MDDQEKFVISQNVIKSVSIIGTEKLSESFSGLLGQSDKKYTAYNMMVKTDYLDYSISRRYNEFASLYQKISGIHSSVKLPPFPKKKIFGSFDEHTILRRKDKLNKFLEQTFSLMVCDAQFLQFIDIKSTFEKGGYSNLVYSKENSRDKLSQSEAFLVDVKANPAIEPRNPEEIMVLKFVRKLNKTKQAKCNIFQKMESHFIGKMQLLNSPIIQYLLIGDSNKEINGLLQNLFVNGEPQDHIPCVTGLQFLRRILEFDYNPLAETSQKIFCDLNMKQIKAIGLQHHIGGEIHKSCKQDALYVLHKYVTGNNMTDNFIQFMLEDDDSYFAYLSYRAKIQNQLQKYSLIRSQTQLEKQVEPIFRSVRATEDKLKISQLHVGQLLSFDKQSKHSWRLVKEIPIGKMWHVSGQVMKIKIVLAATIRDTYKLLTERKMDWLKNFEESRVLQIINSESFVLLERLRIRKGQTFKSLIYICNVTVKKEQCRTLITKESLANLGSYSDELSSNDQLGYYKCVIEIKEQKKKEEFSKEACTIKILILIEDENSKLFFNPILLDEDDSVTFAAKKLEQLRTELK